ncbi:MAG: FxsA family protein [Proteobacteria bacterium]|nr:FxsA family protein [Pseudomonadota bacterium]
MGFIILLAFIAIPLIEIAVFIEVGGFLGLWWTLAIVVGTALAGTAMLRRQGLSTLRRAQLQMAEGRMPLREVFDGLCLLVAGALLLTPGFVTDLAGALLFIAPVRLILGRLVARHIVANSQFDGQPLGAGPHGQQPPRGGADRDDLNHDDIIDVEFEEVAPEDPASIDNQHNDQRKPR